MARFTSETLDYVTDRVCDSDHFDGLPQEAYEWCLIWCAENHDHWMDADCDDRGFFDCTDYEAMAGAAVEAHGLQGEALAA